MWWRTEKSPGRRLPRITMSGRGKQEAELTGTLEIAKIALGDRAH